jgi:hypothetical protein
MNMNVYNIRFKYLGVAYPIHGKMKEYWQDNYWKLGAPVTNEYFWDYGGIRYTAQWFEPTDNYYVSVLYDASAKSYKFCTNSSVAGCPPFDQAVFDQHIQKNLGCVNGKCGVGGDSTEPPVNPNYTFNRSTTCKAVNDPGNYLPVNETIDFSQLDNRVYAWIEVLNVYKSLNFTFRWHDPNGNFVYEYSKTSLNPKDYGWDYWYDRSAYSYLDVYNSVTFGQWRVDILIDGLLVATNYFNLNVVLNYPTNLTAGNITPTSINLNWTPAQHAASYKIYRDNQLIATTTNTSYKDENLNPNTEYSYHIIAANGNYYSSPSDSISARTLVKQLEAPMRFRIIFE